MYHINTCKGKFLRYFSCRDICNVGNGRYFSRESLEIFDKEDTRGKSDFSWYYEIFYNEVEIFHCGRGDLTEVGLKVQKAFKRCIMISSRNLTPPKFISTKMLKEKTKSHIYLCQNIPNQTIHKP